MKLVLDLQLIHYQLFFRKYQCNQITMSVYLPAFYHLHYHHWLN